MISRKRNGQALTILRVLNLHQNYGKLDLLYVNTFKIINWEVLQF